MPIYRKLDWRDCEDVGSPGIILRKALPDAGWKTDWARNSDDQARLERYNCMAWTLGVTDRWIWPAAPNPTLAVPSQSGCDGPVAAYECQFDEMVNKYACLNHPVREVTEDMDPDIACYGANKTYVMHVALRRRPMNVLQDFPWESKMGKTLRIIHRAADISFPEIGHRLFTYLKFTGARPSGATSSSSKPTR